MSAGPATAHRPAVRRSPAPRGPRRVSGPARGRSAAPRAVRTAAAPAVALPRPVAPTLLDRLLALPDSRWLDRLLRGRAWIALIAIALLGLVFMQVSMLRMNAGIGQKVERAEVLDRQNSALRNAVSQLSSEERIQRAATQMGLVMPLAGDVTYLRARPEVDASRAAKVMRAPDPAAAAAAQQQADAAGAATAAPPTQAAQQAQAEEQANAATVPGAATTTGEAQAQTPQPQAETTPQTQPTQPQTAQTQPQAQTQTQSTQPQTQAATPQAQSPPAATTAGAAAAPGTGQ